MATLLLQDVTPAQKHQGEIFSCAWTSDSAFVLTAGWDGNLRLWETTTGAPVTALQAGNKPLSACTISPDGKTWVSGSMEGLLTHWDAHSHVQQSQIVRHTRPISSVRFSPDKSFMVTTSWDRNVCVSAISKERENRALAGHGDIVSGCRFLVDGTTLLTWSHDNTLRLWDAESGQSIATLQGHADRVNVADVSPDGHLAVSGARDGAVILWDLETGAIVDQIKQQSEIRGCIFLLDGATLLTLDAEGRASLFSLAELELQFQLATRQPLQCGELSPSGDLVALGCDDGQLRILAVEGLESEPFFVTATQGERRTATRLQRLFGRSTVTTVYESRCPRCCKPVEVVGQLPRDPIPCPHCRRPLRYQLRPRPAAQVVC